MSEKIESQTVTMAHGAGGKQTSELIDKVFAAHFANPDLTADDAAVLNPPVGKMAVSTDGFIVSPAFFPGGNIGKLSICGTVNDLACMGAKPLYLTCAFVIEEGFPMEKLEQIAEAMAKTAKEAGVRIVSGDTKVAGKGQVDGVFITTTGMGQIEDGVQVGGELAKPGDAVIVTGDIGRHGCTILLAREDFGIEADVKSDCAPLWKTVEAVMDTTHELHVIRDATRGGVGTVLYEIAGQSQVGVQIDAAKIPRRNNGDHCSGRTGRKDRRDTSPVSILSKCSNHRNNHRRKPRQSYPYDRNRNPVPPPTAGWRVVATDLLNQFRNAEKVVSSCAAS